MTSQQGLLRNAPVFDGLRVRALPLFITHAHRVRVDEGGHGFVEGADGDSL